MTPQKRYRRTLRGKYVRHKANAARRGVEFNLTFGQWLVIWKMSGKLGRRGFRMRQFVMCRCGDVGAYEWGNVFIGPARLNLRDGGRRTRFIRRHTANSTTVTFPP